MVVHPINTSNQHLSSNDTESIAIPVDPNVLSRVIQIMQEQATIIEQKKDPPLVRFTSNVALDDDSSPPEDGFQEIRYTRENLLNWKKYHGELLAGMLHGQGKLTFWDGSTQEGNWRNNRLQGYGISIGSDRYGTTMEGNWENGQLQQGTIRKKTGDIYEGEWVNGKLHGHGTHKSWDGFFYIGSWKSGKKDGPGKLICDYFVFEGIFKDNTLFTGTSITWSSKWPPKINVFLQQYHEGSFIHYKAYELTNLDTNLIDAEMAEYQQNLVADCSVTRKAEKLELRGYQKKFFRVHTSSSKGNTVENQEVIEEGLFDFYTSLRINLIEGSKKNLTTKVTEQGVFCTNDNMLIDGTIITKHGFKKEIRNKKRTFCCVVS